jgi:cytochrome c
MMRLSYAAMGLMLLATVAIAQERGLSVEQESEFAAELLVPRGDPERGRLVFGPCRSCHFTDAGAGHGNGPNLHRIFGKVAGKQEGFKYYSPEFKAARYVWTPNVLYIWLENPMASLPTTTMMSAGVPDPQERADLIAYLELVSVRIFPE